MLCMLCNAFLHYSINWHGSCYYAKSVPFYQSLECQKFDKCMHLWEGGTLTCVTFHNLPLSLRLLRKERGLIFLHFLKTAGKQKEGLHDCGRGRGGTGREGLLQKTIIPEAASALFLLPPHFHEEGIVLIRWLHPLSCARRGGRPLEESEVSEAKLRMSLGRWARLRV